MLVRGEKQRPGDVLSAEEELKDPFILEFLGLQDEYSESDVERRSSVISSISSWSSEATPRSSDVLPPRASMPRRHRPQARRVHARRRRPDAPYLNYAREHWTRPGENPPVGLILCAEKDEAVARYALDGLPNKVLAAEYRTKLPREKVLVAELDRTRRLLARRPPDRG
jgi:hypothetical protein